MTKRSSEAILDVETAKNKQQNIPHLFPGIISFILFSCFFINTSLSQKNNTKAAALCLIFILAFIAFSKNLKALKSPLILTSIPIILIITSQMVNGDTWQWRRLTAIIFSLLFSATTCAWLINKNVKILTPAYLSVAIAAIIYFVIWLVFWATLDGSPAHHDWVRDTPFFRNIRHLSYVHLCSVVITAWGYLTTTNRRHRLLFILSFLSSSTLIFWSGGRGGLIAIAAGLIVLSLTTTFNENKLRWLSIFCFFIAGFALSTQYNVQQGSLGIASVFEKTVQTQSINDISSGRIKIWTDIYHKIQTKPWLGWGPDAFIALKIKPGLVQAHNGFLQLLTEGGILFSGFIFSIIFFILYCAIKALLIEQKDSPSKKATTLSLGTALSTSLLTLSLVDGVFYHGSPLTIFCFSIALTAAHSIPKKTFTNNKKT